jgi:hypothetical protein
MANGFHAVKFIMVDFDGSWDRHTMVYSFPNIRYTATGGGGKLAVAVEGPTGTLSTYRYSLVAGEEVLVIDQVIHIPARCVDRDKGNTIKCGG